MQLISFLIGAIIEFFFIEKVFFFVSIFFLIWFMRYAYIKYKKIDKMFQKAQVCYRFNLKKHNKFFFSFPSH